MSKKYKYIFFGSPKFAEVVLSGLIASGSAPMAVVTNPDRPFGRKKTLTPPPVKILAEKNGIPVFQPEKITDELVEEIKKLSPDAFVVAAYAKIIPKKLIDAASLGAIGVHPSLLPLYRGASPIQGALLGGEKETGVSVYLMDEMVDHGPVFAERRVAIEADETYASLMEKLAVAGGELVAEVLPQFFAGKIVPVEQRHELATLTRKFGTEDGFIGEETLRKAFSGESRADAELSDRMIRALNPDPGVWTTRQIKGKPQRIKLLEAGLSGDRLVLKLVQAEGKTPQPAKLYF